MVSVLVRPFAYKCAGNVVEASPIGSTLENGKTAVTSSPLFVQTDKELLSRLEAEALTAMAAKAGEA